MNLVVPYNKINLSQRERFVFEDIFEPSLYRKLSAEAGELGEKKEVVEPYYEIKVNLNYNSKYSVNELNELEEYFAIQ